MIHYSTGDWSLRFLFRWRGSIFPKALVWAIPAAVNAFIIDYLYFHTEVTPNWELGSSTGAVWSSFNFVIGFLVVFRTQAAYARYWEGATLVQQARANLFNASSSLIAFSSADRNKRAKVEEFQHLLVRLMSMMHCVGLQTIADSVDVKFQFFNTDGMDRGCLRFLSTITDKHQRCEIVIQWIQRLVIEARRVGIIDVPPPILTRFFQELSQGATHIINARIMTGIPFPFPYAQLLTTLLICHWLLTPFLCVVVMRSMLWSCIFSFITVFALWGVNYIAAEIESPFGDDPNDLPIHALQKDMNKSLWILLHPSTQAVPKFKFDPLKHRKWDVICQSNFNRSSVEAKSIYAPKVSGIWTQKASVDSECVVHELPSFASKASSSRAGKKRWSLFGGGTKGSSIWGSATRSSSVFKHFSSNSRKGGRTSAMECELPAPFPSVHTADDKKTSSAFSPMPPSDIPHSASDCNDSYDEAFRDSDQQGSRNSFSSPSAAALNEFLESHIGRTIRELCNLQKRLTTASRHSRDEYDEREVSGVPDEFHMEYHRKQPQKKNVASVNFTTPLASLGSDDLRGDSDEVNGKVDTRAQSFESYDLSHHSLELHGCSRDNLG